jgi:hypothetical protein
MADPVPVLCPWCGGSELEPRGDHWFCLACTAWWLAWTTNDRRFLKALHIAPDS